MGFKYRKAAKACGVFDIRKRSWRLLLMEMLAKLGKKCYNPLTDIMYFCISINQKFNKSISHILSQNIALCKIIFRAAEVFRE